jgi:hypothetical protein
LSKSIAAAPVSEDADGDRPDPAALEDVPEDTPDPPRDKPQQADTAADDLTPDTAPEDVPEASVS